MRALQAAADRLGRSKRRDGASVSGGPIVTIKTIDGTVHVEIAQQGCTLTFGLDPENARHMALMMLDQSAKAAVATQPTKRGRPAKSDGLSFPDGCGGMTHPE